MKFFNWTEHNEHLFAESALKLFKIQAQKVDVYKRFLGHLGVNPQDVTTLNQIPFLPVEFFKTTDVYCASNSPQHIFTSSSTTNTGQSRHLVSDLSLYEQSFLSSFKHFYGEPADFCFLCLLPSYLEREGSSLVYMADYLIKNSKQKKSGFYLNNVEELFLQLLENEKNMIPTVLLGVSFALLDFADIYSMNLKSTIVMETGGMKGRRQEIPRDALHNILTKQFGVNNIHSEYGMTELFSQAYSKGNGVFQTPPWMKIMLYNPYNPLSTNAGQTGGINIIDLANQHSCAFIQTSDIGRILPDNFFEILGRFDYSDVRGCNLLVY